MPTLNSMTSFSPELSARVRTGIPLAAGVVLLVFGPSLLFGLAVIIFAAIGSGEFTAMVSKKGVTLPEWMLPGSGVLMGLGALWGPSGLHGMLLICGVSWILHELVFTPKTAFSELNRLGYGIFGMVLVGWSLSHMTLIKSEPNGVSLLFFLLLVISFSDILAYFGGKKFGKTPLAPSISPKKTWEGSLCGAGGSALIAAVFGELALDYFWMSGLLLGLLVAAAGQLGDLVESKIKRLCEVKDSGNLLPGHGGILDRIDGYLIAAPLFYYLVQLG